jgi:hypothetical protein
MQETTGAEPTVRWYEPSHYAVFIPEEVYDRHVAKVSGFDLVPEAATVLLSGKQRVYDPDIGFLPSPVYRRDRCTRVSRSRPRRHPHCANASATTSPFGRSIRTANPPSGSGVSQLSVTDRATKRDYSRSRRIHTFPDSP